MPSDDTRVSVLTAAEFEPFVVAAAHVYGAAMARAPELVVQRREIMQSHLHRTDFVAVVATREGGELVGFGYGYHGRRGEWWHDIVVKSLSRASARQWLDDAFEVAELHVLPAHQGTGLGRCILELLVKHATGSTVVLSTHDQDSPARRLYRSMGFVDLRDGFVFPGSAEVYAIMGLARP